uniref:Bromodomain adjacent to zinc finger domain 2B n=1 Tax=Pygocentrus nattereri TaxID=42514 RepID=A0AAR2K7H5_PYGNA
YTTGILSFSLSCPFLAGHLFQVAGDSGIGMSVVSSAFPMVSHPVFSIYSTLSGRSHFGGLGTLGLPAALTSHPQLGTFPDWWRASDAQVHGAAALFPPLLGLPPLFTPPTFSTDPTPGQPHTPSKSTQASAKGTSAHVYCLENFYDQIFLFVNYSTQTSRVKDDIAARADVCSLDPHSSLLSSFFSRQTSSQPLTLSQASPLLFQNSRPRVEASKHTSVIQATGLAASSKPLPLITQDQGTSSRPPTSSKPLCLALSPKTPSLSSSPKNLSISSFPKPLSLCLSPKLCSVSPAPKPLKHQHSNLFLSSTLLENSHPNGVIQGAVQDAPLDLITKPRSHSSGMPDKASLAAASPCFNTPINLTTGTKEHLPGLVTPNQTSTSPRLSSRAAQRKASRPVHRAGTNSQLLQSLVELARETESDITSSKDSDDSALDEDEAEDEIDKDSDDISHSASSSADSGSNLVSDSDDDDDDDEKEEEEDKAEEMETDTENERTPVRLTKGSTSLTDSTSKMVTSSSSLNLHIHNLPSMSVTPSSSYSLPTPLVNVCMFSFTDDCLLSGSRKRRRVTDERALRRPLEYGWQRETRIMTICGRVQGEVAYYAPCGKKLKQYPDVMKGLQWYLLKDDEVIPRILAMEGRRGRPKNLEHQHPADTSGGNPLRSRHRKTKTPNSGEAEAVSAADAKVLRRLEAQEIARQAAQIKLMRKLEKQALARAAKEAKRQQALLAAEEKRKQKEQLKILKQQEKIRRIQQIRMEKEIRAQQILEAKRKKKEEAANAKIQEAEKRIKERERRRQHMLLMKAMEARKKAEERERLKQEKRDEKRLNKERKLELRRLELEMAKELNKPNEDLSLADQKPLPELSRLPGLLLPGSCFADCLMVMQFLRCFGKVLGLDSSTELPTLHMLQSGLLNLGPSVAHLQDLLVRLLSAAVCDPGLPPGHRAKTALGEHLSSVGINRENVSEILQIYMAAHCSQTELLPLVESLKTKAFQAHTPVQKASILAFLVNELACSKNVVTEIDKNIDHMTNLRREKWVIEGSLRKLRSIYAKRTGKRESSVGNEETHVLGTPSSGRKRKRKTSASEDDDDEDDDTDEGELEDDEEEEGLKKGKRTETFEEEDDGDQTDSVEELERKIEKLTKQQSQIRRKLFESSHSLRSMMFGQDRYKRRYWVLPQCGGVFIEGMESGEGPEELQRERDRLQNAQHIQVKEEPMEVPADKPPCASPDVKREVFSPGPKQEKDSLNLFLQKPGSFSKLSKLLEVAKLSPEPSNHTQGPLPFVGHLLTNTQATLPNSFSSTSTQGIKSELSAPLLSPAYLGNLQQQLHSDQLYRTLTEKNAHWFSLLPRSPCDNSSLAASPTPPPSSSSPEPSPPTFKSDQNISQKALALRSGLWSPPMKPGIHMMGLPFCHWPTGLTSLNMTFGGMSTSPTLGEVYADAEANGNGGLLQTPSVGTCKTESPVLSREKPPEALSPALEMAKNQDLPFPLPIPEEMLTGWWKVSSFEELSSIVNVCHPRGIREKVLQKQIQKHMDYVMQVCAKNKDAAVIDLCELEESQVCKETVEGWCVEEHAMDLDIVVLQQVEELERRVTSASLQVKGWMPPEPQSEREDLVYFQHKAFGENDSEPLDKSETGIVRHANNPLDIAVARLSELERNIERRGEEDLAPGMKQWRKAVSEVRSGAQLSLCLQQLQRSIAWERSIMKVYCQMCRKGDNEELLLLCDGCDKGCHTYCHKPQISTIPEGDWFCPACIAKVGEAVGGGKKTSDIKRNKKACVTGEASEDDTANTSASSTPKKGVKETKKRKTESLSTDVAKEENSTEDKVKKVKTVRDNSKDLELCRLLLAELQSHQDAWPFMTPVNPKSVPGYRKVIKKPMDFSTIREKLSNSLYQNLETFIIDVNLVFDNCEKFNEDNSDIGRAGHNMRRFFQQRWTELLKQINYN